MFDTLASQRRMSNPRSGGVSAASIVPVSGASRNDIVRNGSDTLCIFPSGRSMRSLFLCCICKCFFQGRRRTNTASWSDMRSAGTTFGGLSTRQPRIKM